MAEVINTLTKINELAVNDTQQFISIAENRYYESLDTIVSRICKNP
mgnify:FL=1